MFRPELTTDECTSCRICTPCLLGICSMCRFVDCIEGPLRHECACSTCHGGQS